MSRYKFIENGGVIDTETQQNIPADTSNRHYRAYLEWAAIEGNVTEPRFTLEERKITKVAEMQTIFNNKLKELQSDKGDTYDLATAIMLVDKANDGLDEMEKEELKELRQRFLKIMSYRKQFEDAKKKVMDEKEDNPESIELTLQEY